MAGIKIINILKDDSFQDILEIFRNADAKEVIFVLPKNGKVFRTEDHFAAFASEGAGAGKTISILCNTPQVASWARKYKFNIMSSGKPVRPAKQTKAAKPAAVLASQPPPADQDIREESEDAFQDDVVTTSDETMGQQGQDEVADEADPLHGMHIEDEGGPVDIDQDKDGLTDEPTDEDLTVAELTAAPRRGRTSSAKTDLDYIDAMWRQKAGKQSAPIRRQAASAVVGLRRFLPRRISMAVAVSILVASMFVLGTIVYATTGSATVAITPNSQHVDTQLSIQTSDAFSSVDANFNKIPGQLFQITKTATQEASATGQRDVASKARGQITVSNAFSSSPQILIATTRFESSGGLIFRTLQTVTIPGSTVKNGQTVPGTVTVQVIADKPGEQYNIQADKFTIPAFKERGDTDRYTKIYGQSSEAFSGGANGPSSVVTQADYDTARDAAIAAVIRQIKDAFSQQASGMMILDTVTPSVTKIESTAQPDDAAATFTVTVTATLKTIAFRQSDLFALISQAILKRDRLVVLPEKLDLKYSDEAFKPDIGVLAFTVGLTGTGYAPLDERGIINDIKGMDGTRIHDYFAQKDGVQAATVSLSPFWVRAVPTDSNRIHLQIRYDGQ